jgi:hypothetical protein
MCQAHRTDKLARMGKATSRSGRHAMVAVHVLSSVAWLTLGLTQLVLFAYGSTAEADVRRSAFTMAVFVDNNILQHFAVLSAYTGLILSAMTSWGLLRYWWVTVKFVITVAGFVFAISLLGRWSDAAAEASERGVALPVGWHLAGASAMVVGLTMSLWLSVAKPGGRFAGHGSKKATGNPPQWLWFALLGVPLVDIVGLGYPLAQLAVGIVFPIVLAARRRRRAAKQPDKAHTVVAPSGAAAGH